MELVISISGAVMTDQKQYVLCHSPEVLAAAIEKYPNCPTEVNLDSRKYLPKEFYVCFRWHSGLLVVFILYLKLAELLM